MSEIFRKALHGTGGLDKEVIPRLEAITKGVVPKTKWLVGCLANQSRGESDNDAYLLLHAAQRLATLEAALQDCRLDFARIASPGGDKEAFSIAMRAESLICNALRVQTRFNGGELPEERNTPL